MPKKSHCAYCVQFNREQIPGWGSNGIVEVPGCGACQRRHEGQVKRLESERDRQKQTYETELSNQKKKNEAELSELDGMRQVDLYMQRTKFDSVLSKLRSEVNELKVDYTSEQSKTNFLQLNRDLLIGDVVFGVEGVEISAHRIILAAKSPVLRKMFKRGLPWGPRGVIRILCATAPVVEAAVNFCYTGEISFGEIVPPDEVLKVAHKFEFEHLTDVCEAELCRSINVKNLSHLLRLSRTLGAVRLRDETDKFFNEHFDELKDEVLQIFEPGSSAAASTASITVTLESGPEPNMISQAHGQIEVSENNRCQI